MVLEKHSNHTELRFLTPETWLNITILCFEANLAVLVKYHRI